MTGLCPAEPLTGGGHNWVFDQGSTLCKETDVGRDPKTGLSTGWQIPPNTATDCIVLPVVRNGTVTNLGDIPFPGEAITPTATRRSWQEPARPAPLPPTTRAMAAR
jgi:hypothetical protein